ncbi:hypothetical protein PU630_07680 [Microbacterium horticulturae]|uniref:Uncharacterized protein n=1 Tax=Microbacterium horticulturae TaxID=3028316 RepID=A0ABY8C732_9MICO|nr:hypothetical protein [Microbacterium sp. KACC 23027]WEG10413.1 hypothetical protein PU630_07680 [Microbacterium sp. KACC 23027]
MATIIQTGPDSFIPGDPPTELPDGRDWCPACGGWGLEYDFDGDLTICFGCGGACTVECTNTACPTHSNLHHQGEWNPW